MNNKTTRISLVALIGLLGIMLAAAAVTRMNGLQIGPNPSTTNIDLQSDGDIIAAGDVQIAGDLDVAGTITGGGGIADGDTLSTGLTFPLTGLHLLDTNASHDLILSPGSNITADRTLTIMTGDANRTLTLSGDTTLSGTNTGDQTITLAGDVTGAGTGSFGTTIAAGAVDGAMLNTTGTPNGTKFLRDDMAWVTISGGGDALTTDPLDQFAATTSSEFAGVISDETGTGAVVLANSPALTTPNIGTPSAAVLTNATGLPIAAGLASGTSADLAGRLSDETGTGAVVLANSPTLVTPALGTPSVLTLTNATGLPASSVGTGLTDAQVSDTLTASKVIGTGSSSDAVDLATAEVAGDLPLANIAQFTAGTFAGRALGGGTGDLQAMTNAQARASLSNLASLTSSGAAIAWTATGGTKYSFNTSVESTTVGASTGSDGQFIVFIITKSATAYTVAWNAQFHTLDGTAMPAIPTTTGKIGFYYFMYIEFLDDWVLQGHTEYAP